MSPTETQRIRRAKARVTLAAIRASRDIPTAQVVRTNIPPTPAVMAVIRDTFGPGVVVVVEP